jgi:hypothetical protein
VATRPGAPGTPPPSRMTHPWVALSMIADGEGEAARIVAMATIPSDAPKDLRTFVQIEAIADPTVRETLLNQDDAFRQVILRGSVPFHEAYMSIGTWLLEGRGFVLYDPQGRQLPLLEQEFPRHGLPGVHFGQTPTLEIYRSVAKNARARPTLERLITENLGIRLARGREAVLALWRKGDAPAALEGLQEDVTGLYRLLDLGLKRGTVKLDGKPIPVDWDRRLRGLMRQASAAEAT